MATPQQTPIQVKSKQGIEYRQRLIDQMAQSVGNKASDAVSLSHAEELQRYMQPTSDAAQIAIKNGGSLADAEHANAISAADMKLQQQALSMHLRQQGAPPDQVFAQLQQANLTDAQIYAYHLKYADELAKQASSNDPAKEAAYHARMTAKVAAYRAGRPLVEDVTPGQEATDAVRAGR
jgi:hypothetical protein